MAWDIGSGSKISIARAGNTNFVDLKGILDVTMPVITIDNVEVTDMDSTAREYIPGLQDNGEVSVEMNYEPDSSTDTLLHEIRTSREIVEIKFTLKGMTEGEVYEAFLSSYERNAPVDDRMTATANFQISAQVIGV